MQEERTITVNAELTLSFEVEQRKGNGKNNFEIASKAAIASLRGYLARYPYATVTSIERQNDG